MNKHFERLAALCRSAGVTNYSIMIPGEGLIAGTPGAEYVIRWVRGAWHVMFVDIACGAVCEDAAASDEREACRTFLRLYGAELGLPDAPLNP
ncbi:MAG: hypothetical protein SOZ52_03985 [Pyramidobacter sp.]|nr:hypothetical protein [Pyramidobacter sp.]